LGRSIPRRPAFTPANPSPKGASTRLLGLPLPLATRHGGPGCGWKAPAVPPLPACRRRLPPLPPLLARRPPSPTVFPRFRPPPLPLPHQTCRRSRMSCCWPFCTAAAPQRWRAARRCASACERCRAIWLGCLHLRAPPPSKMQRTSECALVLWALACDCQGGIQCSFAVCTQALPYRTRLPSLYRQVT